MLAVIVAAGTLIYSIPELPIFKEDPITSCKPSELFPLVELAANDPENKKELQERADCVDKSGLMKTATDSAIVRVGQGKYKEALDISAPAVWAVADSIVMDSLCWVRGLAFGYWGDQLADTGKEDSAKILYDSAAIWFTLCTQKSPEQAFGWLGLGQAQLRLNHDSAAVKSYEEYVALRPDSVNGLVNLAFAQASIGDYTNALKTTQKAYSKSPNDLAVLNGLAMNLMHTGKHNEAEEIYNRALKIDRKDIATWVNLAFLKREQGLNKEAKACYDTIVIIDSTFALGWFNKAIVEQTLGLNEEALVSYQKSIALQRRFSKSRFSFIWYNIGVIQMNSDSCKQALKSFDKALQYEPVKIDIWMGKGTAYVKCNDYLKASDCYEEVTRLLPNHADAWFWFAATQAKLGNPKKAKSIFEKALNIAQPDWPKKSKAEMAIECIKAGIPLSIHFE